MKKLICILVGTLYLAGCTTMNAVPVAQGKFVKDSIREGDQIVLLTNHDQHRFIVTSVTPQQICGKDKCVRIEEVESVTRQEFSALKTAGLVVGIVLVGLGAFAYQIRGGILAK